MANYKVLAGFTYWPEGVEMVEENMGKRKEAIPGDILSDLPDESAKHFPPGFVEPTQAHARTADEPEKAR